jgi:hypothetical protein
MDEWAYARPYTSEQERRNALPEWLHTYNHHRAHTALKDQPPASRVPNLTGQYSKGIAEDSGGMLVTDVWRELERFEQFARDEIGPFSRQAGITAAPDTALSVVYNYNFRPAGELPLPGAPIAVAMDYEGSLAQYDEVMDMMDTCAKARAPKATCSTGLARSTV